jgi:repressor LexA
MLQTLPPKQQRLLTYLREYITATGTSPSLRQVAQDLGISHTAVSQTIKLLESKGLIRREGRYGRMIYLMHSDRQTAGIHRIKEVPVVGRIAAGLPMYGQQEYDGSIVVDSDFYKGENLFALYVKGDSMIGAGILHGDLVICEPRQFAHNGEIVVALIRNEEATVKRFFLREGQIVLEPENPAYSAMVYKLGEVLIQGKVVGVQRGPEVMERLRP